MKQSLLIMFLSLWGAEVAPRAQARLADAATPNPVVYQPLNKESGSIAAQDASSYLVARQLNDNTWQLADGQNEQRALALAGIDYLDKQLAWQPTLYEAELAQFSGGVAPTSDAGIGFAAYFNQPGASAVTFTAVTVPEADTYPVDFRYTTANRWVASLSVYVNGIDVTQALFPSTASWTTNWATTSVSLNLRAGSNTIMVRYDADDSGGVNLDYMQVNAAAKLGAAPTTTWFPQEVSVDKFTGTAHLYLPLHTVQVPGVAVPIGLSYAATGVQVDDRGGKVGVNWGLTGQVSISREVRGLPDDRRILEPTRSRYGWLVYPAGSPDASARISAVPEATATFSPGVSCTASEQAALQQLNYLGNIQQVLSGAANLALYDTEPDVFTYSLPGHSGKFVFDAQGRARTMPYDPITITHPPINPDNGLESFSIRTPDGTSYLFDQAESIEKKLKDITASPSYFLRDYSLYKLLNKDNVLSYTYAWQASKITTATNEQITFTYQKVTPPLDNPGKTSHRLARGADSNFGTEDYRFETLVYRQLLQSISSPATTLTFKLAPVDEVDYFIQSVAVTSSISAELIKQYFLDYANPLPNPKLARGGGWYDKQGGPLAANAFNARMFLRRIMLSNGCATQPLYEFGYNQTTATTVWLPPFGANDQDYWGFHNANHSHTLIPQIYVYPGLLGQSTVVPAAPYRLYEASGVGNGFTLPGADRRPAANFQNALAGTLTSVKLPGGGQVVLAYEVHRFFDPVAQQSYPAGGTRIRSIRVQDPVTGLEARRDYGYQLDNGRASGVLLRAPHFALALPATGSTPQEQWTNATARCGDDLTVDPFETRNIGYQQVSEQVTGKGQVVTTYYVPGSADETTATDGITAGITWGRPVTGVARRSYTSPTTGASNCPSVAPLQSGTDQYPLAPATNYDFRRGLPQSIRYLAEPVGTTAAATVRQESFTYQYRNLAPTLPVVTGLAYDQLINGQDNTYAYAKYPILTDFLYAVRQHTQLMPSATLATNQTLTWYNYNSQGRLSTQAQRASDGSYYRTRYKYLADYPLAITSTEPRLQAMLQRATLADKQISEDLVETISEVVSPTGNVRIAGAALNTFTTASAGTLTRPYQTFRWQPAVPIALPSYDSVRVVTNAAGKQELYVPATFRLATTLLDVTAKLVPLSTRTEAGRQVTAIQMGYATTLPILQISNARAPEVLFSDFESTKDFAFEARTGSQVVPASIQAARTGKYGVELPAAAWLNSTLPASAAPVYRLSFWARAAGPASLTVTVAGGSGGTPPAAQTLPVAPTANTWQLYEVNLNLATIPAAARNSYSIKLLTNNTVQLDDILLLPADAAAASTTYDLTKGKTSETDARGRTAFYEYNVLGELTRVRDHNGAIVKQLDRVVAGQLPTISPDFVISGSLYEAEVLAFTGSISCGNNLEYSWDFGDNTTTEFATSAASKHAFAVTGVEKTYQVKLRARIQGQTKLSESYQFITVRPRPLTLSTCTNGIVAIDNCGAMPDRLANTCGSNNPATDATTFRVMFPESGTYTYVWQAILPGSSSWQVMSGATGPAITVQSHGQQTASPLATAKQLYRCTIANTSGTVVGTSEVFSIEHYSSSGTQQNPCPNP